MKKLVLLIPLFSLLFLIGCTQQPPIETCSLTGTGPCTNSSGTLDHSNFSGAITAVLLALKNNDMLGLSTFISSQGLRLSPYEHVDIGTDIILSTQEVASGLSLPMIYTWGAYDGSGEPINLTIEQYFAKFVYDVDFMNAPEVNYNQNTQRGNIINNVAAVYPGTQSKWVEFYFSGFDPQYGGMDRKSLTLVFENMSDQWYLIGVVHGSWTI